MKREFIVERQGKSFVLYAGLLDLAHQQGLKSIRTDLVQVPNETNNRVAICIATVVMEKEGLERTFTGIGDAAPNNVAPAMQTCLIRMAETRSKARALRDAVNVGVAAFEELGEEDAQDGAPERGYSMRPARPSSRTNGNVAVPRNTEAARSTRETPNPELSSDRNRDKVEGAMPIPPEMRHPGVVAISEAQTEAIRNLCRRRELDPDQFVQEKASTTLSELTHAQASDLIKQLNERAATR